MRGRRIAAALMTAWLSAGCASAQVTGVPTPRELGLDLTPETGPRLARMQRPEGPVLLAQATPPPNLPPPNLPSIPGPPTVIPPPPGGVKVPPPPPGGAQQASLKSVRAARANVRAWVNGRPIFDDEVMLELEMRGSQALREGTLEKVTEAYNQTLGNIIDMEVAFQDAIKKLEKGNPRALDKLRDFVEEEYDKQSRQIRKAIPDDKFAEISSTFRRQLERQLIGMEYLRSRILPNVNAVSNQDVEEYYRTHLNEFQKIGSVKWQHVFLSVNAQRPAVADVRRFAESLMDQVRGGGDLALLAKHDDGDGKLRGSLGFGTRRGEIKPAELEQYLFKMRPGQAGMLEMSTGVHLFRLVEREDDGQIAFNEQVQAQIRNKLRNQIFDREVKRLVRDLRARSIIEIEKGT